MLGFHAIHFRVAEGTWEGGNGVFTCRVRPWRSPTPRIRPRSLIRLHSPITWTSRVLTDQISNHAEGSLTLFDARRDRSQSSDTTDDNLWGSWLNITPPEYMMNSCHQQYDHHVSTNDFRIGSDSLGNTQSSRSNKLNNLFTETLAKTWPPSLLGYSHHSWSRGSRFLLTILATSHPRVPSPQTSSKTQTQTNLRLPLRKRKGKNHTTQRGYQDFFERLQSWIC